MDKNNKIYFIHSLYMSSGKMLSPLIKFNLEDGTLKEF